MPDPSAPGPGTRASGPAGRAAPSRRPGARGTAPGARGPALFARPARPIPPDKLGYLVSTAARAPSLHNTQPWRFVLDADVIELRADRDRRLNRTDPAGREMLISCGAALFGLRLAMRGLGYRPAVELMPSQDQPDLLARLWLGAEMPITPGERALLAALSQRYTMRGPFTPGALPVGLLAGLQHDAVAERATLVRIGSQGDYQRLAELVTIADRRQRVNPAVRAEVRRWTRPADSDARDGVPARAYPADTDRPSGSLALRDFDLGRHWGRLDGGGATPPVTLVLVTGGDEPSDWLHAGQALHRLLAHAAGSWVFASLHSQPLESAPLRAEVRAQLALPGPAQMLLQLGRSHVARPTARRPVSDVLTVS